jgi:hypothetical protein
MRILLALVYAIVAAVVGFVSAALVCAIGFEVSARTSPPNIDLQPGSAWVQGAIFGGLAYGSRLALLLAVIAFLVGLRHRRDA